MANCKVVTMSTRKKSSSSKSKRANKSIRADIREFRLNRVAGKAVVVRKRMCCRFQTFSWCCSCLDGVSKLDFDGTLCHLPYNCRNITWLFSIKPQPSTRKSFDGNNGNVIANWNILIRALDVILVFWYHDGHTVFFLLLFFFRSEYSPSHHYPRTPRASLKKFAQSCP